MKAGEVLPAALAAAGGLVAGYAGERALAARLRGGPDPFTEEDFSPLSDSEHRVVATDDGGEVFTAERGRGRPLLLFHGLTLSSATWRYQLLDLADEFRLITADHRGHGRSQRGSDGCTLQLMAEDVGGLLEELDLHDAVLVGHSLGAMVILKYLADNPGVYEDRVDGLVLLGATATWIVPASVRMVFTRVAAPAARRGARYLGRFLGGHFPSNDLTYAVTRLGWGTDAPETLVELNRAMIAATPYEVFHELSISLFEYDVRQLLSKIELPTLLLVGGKDMITPRHYAEDIAEGLPNAELVVLPGAGHMLMFERRAEVADHLRRFCRSLPPMGEGRRA